MLQRAKDILNKGEKRSVTIKKNIIGSLFIKGCSIIISLMLVPMTLGYVSQELYGIWLTLSSVVLWLNFFDVGFTLGLKNKLAEAIAQKDWNKGKRLVSTTYAMMFLVFVPLYFILSAIIPFVNWSSFLNVSANYNEEIKQTLYILTGCFCCQMIANVLVSVIAAFQKTALSSAFTVIGNGLSLIVIYFLTIYTSSSLTNLAWAISSTPVLVIAMASIVAYRTKFKRICPDVQSIDRKEINNLLSLGLQFFLIQIQVVVLYQATNILISNVSSPEDVTSYNIAYKYLGVTMMLFTIILNPLWPAFTEAYTQRDFVWMRRTYKKMCIVFGVSAIILCIMTIASPFIYEIWIRGRASIPFIITTAVAVYMAVHCWCNLQVQLINGIGKLRIQIIVTTIGMLIHIPLSLRLGHVYGAVGVIISMIAINLVYSIFFTIQINKLITNRASGIWVK